MHYRISWLLIGILFSSLACNSTTKVLPMNQQLNISAQCRGNTQCVFNGKDIFIDISIINKQGVDVGFPLEYVQKTGPSIELTDTKTKASSYVRKNLADHSLRDNFFTIQSGKSATLEWIITADELNQFNKDCVDITAKIIVASEILVDGKKVNFQGSDLLKFSDKRCK